MKKNPTTAEKRLKTLMKYAGKKPSKEIAAMLDITVGNLYQIASKLDISLALTNRPAKLKTPAIAKKRPVPAAPALTPAPVQAPPQVPTTPQPQKRAVRKSPEVATPAATTPRPKPDKKTALALAADLDDAVRLLLSNGYTVRRPDPFIELKERANRAT